MATLRAAVKAALTGDATLMAILSGGVRDWKELGGRLGLTPTNAQYETDGVTLKPQAVLTWGAETPVMETYNAQGRRRFCQLWVYDHDDQDVIEQALRRAEAVLHRALIATDDARRVLVLYANDGPDFIADELGGAPGRFSRYVVQLSRR